MTFIESATAQPTLVQRSAGGISCCSVANTPPASPTAVPMSAKDARRRGGDS